MSEPKSRRWRLGFYLNHGQNGKLTAKVSQRLKERAPVWWGWTPWNRVGYTSIVYCTCEPQSFIIGNPTSHKWESHKCQKYEPHNVRSMNPTLSEVWNSQCQKYETHNVKSMKPTMSEVWNPQCQKYETHNVRSMNPTLSEVWNSQCQKDETHNVRSMKSTMSEVWNPQCQKCEQKRHPKFRWHKPRNGRNINSL